MLTIVYGTQSLCKVTDKGQTFVILEDIYNV